MRGSRCQGHAMQDEQLNLPSIATSSASDANSIDIEHVISAQSQMEQDRAITLMRLTRSPEINRCPSSSIKEMDIYTKQWDYLETYTQFCASRLPTTDITASITIINEFDLAGLAHVKNVPWTTWKNKMSTASFQKE